jgi:peptide methionine sulfoxide reductase msrA/msrB
MTDKLIDEGHGQKPDIRVIYLAGGCFWGMQKLMQSIPGVVSAVSGYANGNSCAEPTYQVVCTGATGYRETVRVEYDPEKVSLDALLFAYFSVIDPGQRNAQGPDTGTQYQTGIYYADERSGQTAERIANIEREQSKRFFVEIEPLKCFYEAEEYHQRSDGERHAVGGELLHERARDG